jgi:hypothetical protein
MPCLGDNHPVEHVEHEHGWPYAVGVDCRGLAGGSNFESLPWDVGSSQRLAFLGGRADSRSRAGNNGSDKRSFLQFFQPRCQRPIAWGDQGHRSTENPAYFRSTSKAVRTRTGRTFRILPLDKSHKSSCVHGAVAQERITIATVLRRTRRQHVDDARLACQRDRMRDTHAKARETERSNRFLLSEECLEVQLHY